MIDDEVLDGDNPPIDGDDAGDPPALEKDSDDPKDANKGDGKEGEKVELSPEEVELFRRHAYETERQNKIKEAVATIKRTTPDFDFEAVKNHLIGVYKKDKKKAEELNNPIGWELVWTKIKASSAKDYDFDPPKNGTGESKEKLIEEAASGDLMARANLIAARRRA
jgi:hypothetical protein